MKKLVLAYFSFVLIITGCGLRINDSEQDKSEKFLRKTARSVQKEIYTSEEDSEKVFREYLDSFSVHDKVCQLFIENLEGDTVYYPVEKDFIPGGYLFFSYNLKNSAEGIMRFTDSIREWAVKNGEVPPYLALDQEGGFVNRLKVVCGPLPSAQRVASKKDVYASYRLYSSQAKQMASLGFDMNIAPVVEICTSENEEFLHGRSYGSYNDVRLFGTACVNAFENHGVGTVIKHFPGNTNTDPHTGLPEIKLPYESLMESLKPFSVINRSSPAGALMSHARTTAVDSEVPACFSKKWIKEILSSSFGFEGIIFSDDIFMGALTKLGYPPEEAAVLALQAGVNVIMVSEKRISSTAKVLIKKASQDEEFRKLIDDSFRKVMLFKRNHGIISVEADDAGALFVKNNYNPKPVLQRLYEFNKARKENIEIYIEYFE